MLTYDKPYSTEHEGELSLIRELELASKGMTLDEFLATRGWEMEDFSPETQRDFRIAHRKCKTNAIRSSMDKLFVQMDNPRGGKDACLQYLVRNADKWDEDINPVTGFTMKFNK